MHLEDLVNTCHKAAVEKGFASYGKQRTVAEHVALLVTEIGELFECTRDGMQPTDERYEYATPSGKYLSIHPETAEGVLGKPVGIPSELADLVIRICDFAGEWGIDLENAVREKMAYNLTRAHMHGRQS
jgi:NTP pyrophosphatase (non-canonical NTP hydrolase)